MVSTRGRAASQFDGRRLGALAGASEPALPVDRIDFLRTQPAGLVSAQGIDVGQRHPAQKSADLDDHAAVGAVGRGRISAMAKSPVVLYPFVLVEFGVLHDELADGGREAADVESARRCGRGWS